MNEPEICHHYELLTDWVDGSQSVDGVRYFAGEVVEIECDLIDTLKGFGVISGEPTDKPATRRRVLMNGCAGCGPSTHTVVIEPDPVALAAASAAQSAKAKTRKPVDPTPA